MPEIAEILRNTITTTGTLEDRDAKVRALYTDVAAFSDTSRDFLDDQRRQPDPARRGRRSPAAGPREVRPGVPLPAPGHRQRRRAAGRGVPRVHPPHRARDAARPAARLQRPTTCPGSATTRGPYCRNAAQPAVLPGQPGPHPARLRRRRRRADRQGHQPDRPGYPPAASASPAAPPSPPCSTSLLGPALGVTADDVPDLGALLVGPMARGARGEPAMKMLDKKTAFDLDQAADLHA